MGYTLCYDGKNKENHRNNCRFCPLLLSISSKTEQVALICKKKFFLSSCGFKESLYFCRQLVTATD
jgi:hypothetical protein